MTYCLRISGREATNGHRTDKSIVYFAKVHFVMDCDGPFVAYELARRLRMNVLLKN